MNISLTPELDRLVQQKVASGSYKTASEVIREGLRLLQQQDELRAIHLQQFRDKLARGLEQLDSRQSFSSKEGWNKIRARKKSGMRG